jgi:hypothetical protein
MIIEMFVCVGEDRLQRSLHIGHCTILSAGNLYMHGTVQGA